MVVNKILLIEDDSLTVKLLRSALPDYVIVNSPSYADAHKALKINTPYNLIILDWWLEDHPNAGSLLLDEIAASNKRTIPIIVTTGHNTDAALVESMNKGARYFIRKPYDIKALRVLVQETLRR